MAEGVGTKCAVEEDKWMEIVSKLIYSLVLFCFALQRLSITGSSEWAEV
jgi:hypothetical protein